MQISALVFIPLGVTRSFTTGLITFCSLQVVEPVRLVVHKIVHWFNAGECFSPTASQHSHACKNKQTFNSCLVDLCWESYGCECLAVLLWIVEQQFLSPTFNQRSTLFSHVYLQMAAKIGDQPNMNSSSPVIDPSLYGFGGPKRTLDNGGKLLTTFTLWICSIVACLSSLWSLSVTLKLLGKKQQSWLCRHWTNTITVYIRATWFV